MDTESSEELAVRWRRIVSRITVEWQGSDASERSWVRARLERIAALQSRLHARFIAAGGPGLCSQCQGQCCGCGRNHVSLVNLLGFLAAGQTPPEPDFAVMCPFLGPSGCCIEVERRPFNCVTFICEAVEEAMAESERIAFYADERALRRLYAEFDSRFAGSSLRGLLIRAARLGKGSFLAPAQRQAS